MAKAKRGQAETGAGAEAPADLTTPGGRLRAARLAAGLSLAQLGALVGTRVTLISDREHGRKPTPLEWAYTVALAMGCKPSVLDARLSDRLPG